MMNYESRGGQHIRGRSMMAVIPGVLTGTVRGNIIELDEAPGLPDGQTVQVTVRPVQKLTDAERLEFLKRAAGGWADDDPEGLDRYLEWNRQQRKANRREIPE
jgi:hypothetical protein